MKAPQWRTFAVLPLDACTTILKVVKSFPEICNQRERVLCSGGNLVWVGGPAALHDILIDFAALLGPHQG